MPVAALPAAFAAALARLGPFGPHPELAVAVSGGADSTALALLAQEYCLARGGRILALIVDHGLRDTAAAEADLTAQRLCARGIAARILTLHNLPRGARLQEAARHARYAALAQEAASAGFLHVLLGHHRADQAETISMRALRGPGGAEGMAAWAARHQILLLRPLLGMDPETLRAYLRAQRMAWIEDPSNQSQKFERVRIRKAGTHARPEGAAARVAREQEAAQFLAAHAQLYPQAYALLDAASAPPAALGALIRALGGAPYMPRQASLATLAAKLRAATCGGVRILPAGRLGAGWLLTREPAACSAPIAALPGVLWDGRFTLTLDPGPFMVFGALGVDANKFNNDNELPAIIRRTQPCLRGPDGAIIFPAPVLFTPPAPVTAHPFLS